MRECGITSFRTSIQWSRVMTDREGTINPEGLAFYDRLVDALIANGIQPMLCLLHFDLPMYWMEKGGFERRETVKMCIRDSCSTVHGCGTFDDDCSYFAHCIVRIFGSNPAFL